MTADMDRAALVEKMARAIEQEIKDQIKGPPPNMSAREAEFLRDMLTDGRLQLPAIGTAALAAYEQHMGKPNDKS